MMKLSMTRLQFASHPETRYRYKNGSMVQGILAGVEPSRQRNMRFALDFALEDCYSALENEQMASEPPIGTIIYVFTDGMSLCNPRQFRAVKDTIKAAVEKLERSGSLKYVGIQFIQFGGSEEASIVLKELNDWLYQNEDILNTEQFSANVFKMHSGRTTNEHTAKTSSKSTVSDQTPNLNTIGHLGKTYNDGKEKDQKSVQNDAPEIIKDDLEYRDVFGSGPVWTCTPSQDIQMEDIPLTISGHPVVVPVEYHYPASAFTVPPPDPHPHFIDSSSEVDEDTMNDIFRTFEGVLGFYLLINGMLQLIVPDDFDFEYGLSHQPNEFGGLRVSYIFQAIEPTAERQQGLSSTSLEQHSITEQSNVRQRVTESSSPKQIQSQLQSTPTSSPSASINRTPGQANLMDLKIGSMVQARVKRSKVTERFQGKIGVMTEAEGQYYLVVPSHILTKALTAAKSDRFPGENWKDHVMVTGCNGGREVGQIAETFDPYARIFPHGFQCDVSLVDVTPTAMSLVPSMRSPIPADWLSQAGWSSIKYNSQNLFLLDKPDLQAKSIGILVSQCQMVGQAILKLSEKSGKKTRFRFPFQQKKSDTVTDVETWTGAVSRSVLYRVDSTSLAPGALSGVAVCVRESSDDDTSCAKIAGFSSWAQPVSDYTRFDMEGPKFYNRLQEGRVAFYGAFQAPPQLRDGHRIV
ncbi:hypothetical protein BKA66DRAFT_156482 [Pyrenochaeta sp. MPI-SDFR-AT-0127]|nr:hypothetical protein BKA66DRAFT_156482 [Pyrenochaeta sp. MPI-SDFR-AT-0127]